MNKLIISLLSIVLVLESPAAAKNEVAPSRIPFYILNAASAYGIDSELMYAICLTESRCKARAMNHNDGTKAEKEQGIVKKAYGLFQIQLETAEFFGFVPYETITVTKQRRNKIVTVTKIIDHTKDLLKPEINSLYAAQLLHKLYKKYHDTAKVVSAYNAGHYTSANKDYVNKVFSHYVKLKIDRNR